MTSTSKANLAKYIKQLDNEIESEQAAKIVVDTLFNGDKLKPEEELLQSLKNYYNSPNKNMMWVTYQAPFGGNQTFPVYDNNGTQAWVVVYNKIKIEPSKLDEVLIKKNFGRGGRKRIKPTKNVNPLCGLNSSWSMTDKALNPSSEDTDLNLQRFKTRRVRRSSKSRVLRKSIRRAKK